MSRARLFMPRINNYASGKQANVFKRGLEVFDLLVPLVKQFSVASKRGQRPLMHLPVLSKFIFKDPGSLTQVHYLLDRA